MAGTTEDRPRSRLSTAVSDFLAAETAGAIVLLVATVVALVWANSPWQGSYQQFWSGASRDVIDDGLMTVFFFVVGLELRREIVAGELRQPRSAALPALAALGGMVLPALIYASINAGHAGSPGWGVPMATDVAFAVGVVAIAGPRVAPSLKPFLLALAIVDDIGAIIVIAVFYSSGVNVVPLVLAIASLLLTAGLRGGVTGRLPVFLACGVTIWFFTYQSGVHATIAGVALGFAAPSRPAEMLEHRLHPWSSFAVLPLFALANAGVTLHSSAFSSGDSTRVVLGIALGLVVGKTLGISAATLLAVRTGVGRLPEGTDARQVVGVAGAAGLGFTVSLFVSGLAFGSGAPLEDSAKVGILIGSTAAAIGGFAVLSVGRAAAPRR